MSTVMTQGMSTEEFLQLPDDGIERVLIRGQVVEWGVTIRNKFHSRCLVRLAAVIETWAEARADLAVLGGEAGFQLQRDPDTNVGIDLAIVPASLVDAPGSDSTIVQGIPLVAIEILSPSDTQGRIREKTQLYLRSGVQAVWLVDPEERTIRIHRASRPPEQFNESEAIVELPELPGLQVNLARLFR